MSFSTMVAVATPPPNFTGSFSGIYAPNNWQIAVSGNPAFDGSAGVLTGGAPNNVTIVGAIGPGSIQTPPVSVIDYSTVLGQGASSVSFTYTFLNPINDPVNVAELFNGSKLVATLTSINQQYRSNPGDFTGGDTLDFRVISANENQVDILEISPIPEPSTLALAGLGAAAFLLRLRRKSAWH